MTSLLPDLAVDLTAVLLVALAAFLGLTITILAAWVYQDAVARESEHPLLWAVGVGLVAPLIAGYVYARGERSSDPSDRENLTLALLLGLLGAWILGSILAPPDPASQAVYVIVGALVTIPLFYFFAYRNDGADDGNGASTGETREEKTG